LGFTAVLVEDVITAKDIGLRRTSLTSRTIGDVLTTEDIGFRYGLSLASGALRVAAAKDIWLRAGDLSA
jgi:hypothetical protein